MSQYRQHYDHKGYRHVSPMHQLSWFAKHYCLTLFIILCLWLLVSTLDYEETRRYECASMELQWDAASDKCFRNQPGDLQNAKTKENRKTR